MSTIYLGIDPGLDGCVAVIFPQIGRLPSIVQFHDTPTIQPGKRRRYDMQGMLDILKTYRPAGTLTGVFAALEEVHAMPGQGVTSMFSMGMGLAAWQMALTALGIPFQAVTPQRWQGVMLAGTAPAKKPKEKKARSYQVARRLWPHAGAELLGPKGGIRDGRSDALLIASWAAQTGLGKMGSHDADDKPSGQGGGAAANDNSAP